MLTFFKNFKISILLTISCITLSSCFDQPERLPPELNLTQVVFELTKSQNFGPGGSNHTFTIFRLDDDVTNQIIAGKTDYLKKLPSVATFKVDKWHSQFSGTEKYWKPFKNWQETPIPKDERWIRRSYKVESDEKPHLSEFFGDAPTKHDPKAPRYVFTGRIPQADRIRLNEMISQKGAFYSYGGYRNIGVLIVSPAWRQAYYLYRD